MCGRVGREADVDLSDSKSLPFPDGEEGVDGFNVSSRHDPVWAEGP